MGLTVSTLTPAIEKAKNVATESYVDSTVSTASAALETAYIAYNNTVKQALIDGEISDAETTAIAAAEAKVNAAKTLLNASIVTAQTTANTAISNAAAANTLLADIASDSKLTPDEKTATQKEWDIIVSEYSKNTTQASTYSVSSSTYTTHYNSLNNYITPLLSSLSTTSTIVGATFRAYFKNYYDARTDLLNAISTNINANAAAAASTALSNANAYTNSAISGSGFVLPSGVATAVNNNTTTINGSKITTGSIAAAQIAAGTITSDKISTYNLTAANATFANSIITNATIANGAITNAKIGDLSVSTIKIQDQAITIPISTINYNLVRLAQAYTEVAAIGFWSSGAPVNLFLSSVLNSSSLENISALVTRDGIPIYDSVTTSVGRPAGQYGNIVFNLRDTCGVGYHEYRFYLKSSGGATFATLSTILGLEVKK